MTLSLPLAWRAFADRWLLRIGNPDPSPTVLTQRRIYLLPTRAGLAFAGALVVMLVASINYNLSLGYALCFLLAGIAVASIMHAFRNLLRLSVSPLRVEPVFVGDQAGFRLLIANHRNHSRPALRVRAGDAAAATRIAAADTTTVNLSLPARTRGWLPLGRITIETTYPLGLVRAWSVVAPDLSCLVFPAPEKNAPPLPAAGTGGARAGFASERGDEDFAGLRTHVQADSPRHVAWKVVARGGPMVTKQFSGLAGGILEFDWSALPATLDDEARIARLTAWVLAAEQRGAAFALRLPDAFVPAQAGPDHTRACLTRLALSRRPRNADD